MMRNILGQHRSSFNFDAVMDDRKILLVNLSKGKIGETNAHMLGLILIAKLQAAVLKRAHRTERERTPFYLYVDEFQNFTTDTFTSILSESRKYALSVHITNQYLSQLPEAIKDSVLGNVGTIATFEVGAEDAQLLAKEFEPLEAADFMGLERFNFYIRLMIDGKTSRPFSGKSLAPAAGTDIGKAKDVIALNRLAYGAPVALVAQKVDGYLR
jgi:hypothetical protein